MSWGLVRLPPDKLALVFSYTDPQAGPSAKGVILANATATNEEAAVAASRPNITVRVGPGLAVEPLSAHEVSRLALPAEPSWMEFFRTAPPTPWLEDPFFKSRFHPEYPNDLQAHFFITASKQVEQMWVRLGAPTGMPNTYAGVLLNTAHSDPSLKQGLLVKIRGAPGAKAPLWLSPVMEENLRTWDAKCQACGFDLMLEPAADVIKRSFPNAPAGSVMHGFTMRCAMCNQTMMVQMKAGAAPMPVHVQGSVPAPAPAGASAVARAPSSKAPSWVLPAVVAGLFVLWFIVKRLL
ncbi:MAG: hypothetical protein QM817_41070 [Archangium sp.]